MRSARSGYGGPQARGKGDPSAAIITEVAAVFSCVARCQDDTKTQKELFAAGIKALRSRMDKGPVRTDHGKEETNFNPESAFKNMPTWFAKSSGLPEHTVPRYMANMDNYYQSGKASMHAKGVTCEHLHGGDSKLGSGRLTTRAA